jgi:hypothetical protein
MGNGPKSWVLRDTAAAVVFIVVGLLAIVLIRRGGVASRIVETQTLTYATLPTLYGALLVILAGILGAGSVLKMRIQRREPPAAEKKGGSRVVRVRTFGTLVLLLAYALLLEHLPFLVLTAAFLAVLFLLYGRRPIWMIACLSVLGGLGFYYLFIYFLNLPL